MRLFAITLSLALGAGCSSVPEVAAPTESSAVDTAAAPVVTESLPEVAPAAVAAVHGTWVADGATIIVGDEGVGAVEAGVASFQPFTVTRQTSDELILTAEDGGEYRFALGASPALTLSSRPDVTLTRR